MLHSTSTRRVLAALGAAAALGPPALGQACGLPLFKLASETTVGADPSHFETADLDADGDLDLVITNAESDSLMVLLNDGAGALTVAQTLPTGSLPTWVAVGDLDNDGWPDAAVTDRDADQVSIFLSNGAGALTPAGSTPLLGADNVAIGDLDADGFADLVVGSMATEDVRVLINRGDATFVAEPDPVLIASQPPVDLRLADLNQDGAPDVLATFSFGAGSGLKIRLSGQPGGVLEPVGVGGSGSYLDVGDLDADGVLDVASFAANGSAVAAAFGVMDGGAYSLEPIVLCDAGPQSFCRAEGVGVSIADFDADGIPDIAGGGNVFFGLGGGSFGVLENFDPPRSVVPGARFARLTRSADMNADGLPDLVVMDSGFEVAQAVPGPEPETVLILLNTGLAHRDWISPPGNGDGRPAAAQLDDDAAAELIGFGEGVTIYDIGPGGAQAVQALIPDQTVIAIASEDFDADGEAEIIASVSNGRDGALLVLDRLGGEWTTVQTIALSGRALITLAAADADGDLDADVVAWSSSTAAPFLALAAFINDGGVLAPAPLTPTTSAFFAASLDVGDIDQDGLADAVIGGVSGDDNASQVLFGVGDGTFAPEASPPAAPFGGPVELVDLDNDGDLDLFGLTFAEISVEAYAPAVRWNEAGALGPPQPETAPLIFEQLDESNTATSDAGDFDADGRTDIAVGRFMLLNTGEGRRGTTFGAYNRAVGAPFGVIKPHVVAADFNADGRDDVAMGGQNGASILVTLSCTCSPDFDGSGFIDAADLNVVLAGFGCVYDLSFDHCPGDLNRDFRTDAADLNEILGRFQEACDR